jgi:hypothetical protein
MRKQIHLPSTLLISPAPKPVNVRLCLGLENPGPTGPCRSDSGALVEGRRSRGAAGFDTVAMIDRNVTFEYYGGGGVS